MNIEPNTVNAARLVYKAMQVGESPLNDGDYRRMLSLYRADEKFADQVNDICTGMELTLLDVSERGLVVAPASANSRFALKLGDIRVTKSPEQRAALALAHLAVSAVCFPTTDQLDDDTYSSPPVAASACRDTLMSIARRLKESESLSDELPKEVVAGYTYINSLPVVTPDAQRASPNSLTGLVTLALQSMRTYGLLRLDRASEEDEDSAYTPTYRLRVQLRELTLKKLYAIAQTAAVNEGQKPDL